MLLIQRMQLAGIAAVLVALGIGGFVLWRYLKGKSPLDIASDVKENTPLGIPARAIDRGVSAVTGREETLGGWIAEIFDPSTREVNRMLGAPTPLPHDNLPSSDIAPYHAP